MIKTGKELAYACELVAKHFKTLYVLGCIGAPMTNSGKARYTKNLAYNAKADRKAKIEAASADTFGFDCVCLIKSLLWGWSGDKGKVYGGAVYASNGVPDIGTEQIIDVCSGVSADFSNIQIGELLWMKGHVGIYVGEGFAVECTPAWKDGVQITAVHNIGTKSGYNGRKWTKHGRLPYVSYEADEEDQESSVAAPIPADFNIGMRTLKRGCCGAEVNSLQLLLIGKGFDCGRWGADGDFGAATEAAVKAFQREAQLDEDGIAGEQTVSRLWQK